MVSLRKLYERNGKKLKVDGKAHTSQQSTLMFTGEKLERFWIKEDCLEEVEIHEKMEEGGLWDWQDYPPFLWEIADKKGLDVGARQIPCVLPPIDYNVPDTKYGFARSKDKVSKHLEEMLMYLEEESHKDFYATWLRVPDVWWHGLRFWDDGIVTKESYDYVTHEAVKLSKRLSSIVEDLDQWVILGDHGAPDMLGSVLEDEEGNQVLVEQHEPESVIFSNLPDLPDSTGEIFDWLLDRLKISFEEEEFAREKIEKDEEEIKNKLEELGYR